MLRRMSKPVCPQRPVSAFKFSFYCLQLANAHCQKGKRRKRWVVWKKMRLQTARVVYPTNWRRSCQKSSPPNKCESQWPGRLWSMFSCDKQNDHNMILSTSYFKYVWNCCFSNTDIPENSWMESNCEAFVLATLWHYGDTMVTLWWYWWQPTKNVGVYRRPSSLFSGALVLGTTTECLSHKDNCQKRKAIRGVFRILLEWTILYFWCFCTFPSPYM